MTARRYVLVSGWVQGVGFRYFVKHTAAHLGLTGWVRNLDSGEVELEVQGDRALVEQFLDALREGNRYSHVTGLWARNMEPEPSEYNFEIIG